MQSLQPPQIERRSKSNRKPIRVFLVDDSPLALVMLQRMLATSSEIEVDSSIREVRGFLNS